MRRDFESERKAQRKNFYRSIISDRGSPDPLLDLPQRMNSDNIAEINPKWNRNLVSKFGMNRRMNSDSQNLVNYSMSIPKDQEGDFMS